MKRLTIFYLAGLCLIGGAAWAWKYSCSTTWQGNTWNRCSVSFTPATTTANLQLCSPFWFDCYSRPCGQGHAQWWVAKVSLTNGTNLYGCSKYCGGNCSQSSVSVTTNETWTLETRLDWLTVLPLQACGPATGYAFSSDATVSCASMGPGGP